MVGAELESVATLVAIYSSPQQPGQFTINNLNRNELKISINDTSYEVLGLGQFLTFVIIILFIVMVFLSVC